MFGCFVPLSRNHSLSDPEFLVALFQSTSSDVTWDFVRDFVWDFHSNGFPDIQVVYHARIYCVPFQWLCQGRSCCVVLGSRVNRSDLWSSCWSALKTSELRLRLLHRSKVLHLSLLRPLFPRVMGKRGSDDAPLKRPASYASSSNGCFQPSDLRNMGMGT